MRVFVYYTRKLQMLKQIYLKSVLGFSVLMPQGKRMDDVVVVCFFNRRNLLTDSIDSLALETVRSLFTKINSFLSFDSAHAAAQTWKDYIANTLIVWYSKQCNNDDTA